MPRVRVEYEELDKTRWVGNAEAFVPGLGARRHTFTGNSRATLERSIREWLDEVAPETAVNRGGRPPKEAA